MLENCRKDSHRTGKGISLIYVLLYSNNNNNNNKKKNNKNNNKEGDDNNNSCSNMVIELIAKIIL